MKKQFIICGWHMNQDSLIDGLNDIQQRDDVDVFWSCHREPTDKIKENFEHKEFFNGAEEMGAYQQAISYLNLEDDTILFCMHDDMIIHDWEFVEECIKKLDEGYVVVGNGYNPGHSSNPSEPAFPGWDPSHIIPVGITEEFDNKRRLDYVHPKNQHYFEGELPMQHVRVSFMCVRYSDMLTIGGFEPRDEAYVSPLDGNYRDNVGLGSFGNLFPMLTMYKINKVFGWKSITWLSNSFKGSKYITELFRGG